LADDSPIGACGIAIVAVSCIVEERQLVSDRGKEALLWLLTVPLAMFLVFLAKILVQTWRLPKLSDIALSGPAPSDRWIAAQAKVLAKRPRESSVTLWKSAPILIACVVFFLWAVVGDARRSGTVGAGDVLGLLVAAVFLIMLLIAVTMWRRLRDSERSLARVVQQRSSKAIDL
jgi:cobalamin synthase